MDDDDFSRFDKNVFISFLTFSFLFCYFFADPDSPERTPYYPFAAVIFMWVVEIIRAYQTNDYSFFVLSSLRFPRVERI